MKKIIYILVFISVSTLSVFSAEDFVVYYNNAKNWEGGIVEKGKLIVNKKLELNTHLVIKENVIIRIEENGSISNNRYQLHFTGSLTKRSNLDPRVKYWKQFMIFLNEMIMEDE